MGTPLSSIYDLSVRATNVLSDNKIRNVDSFIKWSSKNDQDYSRLKNCGVKTRKEFLQIYNHFIDYTITEMSLKEILKCFNVCKVTLDLLAAKQIESQQDLIKYCSSGIMPTKSLFRIFTVIKYQEVSFGASSPKQEYTDISLHDFHRLLKSGRHCLSVRANNGLTIILDDLFETPSNLSYFATLDGVLAIKNIGMKSAKELHNYYTSCLTKLSSASTDGSLEKHLNLFSLESDLEMPPQSISAILDNFNVKNVSDIDQLVFTIECIKYLLSDRDKSIMKSFFYDDNSLTEIASNLSMTRERVRQLITRLYSYTSAQGKNILDTLRNNGYYLSTSNYDVYCISDRDIIKYQSLAFPVYLIVSIIASWNNLVIYDKRKRKENYFYYRKDLVDFDFNKVLKVVDGLFPNKVMANKSVTIRSLLSSSLIASDSDKWKHLVSTITKYVHSYKNGSVTDDVIHINRTSKKKKHEYIVEILEKEGTPMLVDDIAVHMNRIEGLKKSTGSTVSGNIQNHPECFINMEWSTYGLKRWEDEGKMVGGTIKQIIAKYLMQFDKPKHISEIAEYVCKHRDTNQASVWGNITLDPKEIFVTYASSFVGLSSKKYRFSDTSFNRLSNRWFKRMTEVYFTGNVCHSTMDEVIIKLASDLKVRPVQIRAVINERLTSGDLRITAVGRLALGSTNAVTSIVSSFEDILSDGFSEEVMLLIDSNKKMMALELCLTHLSEHSDIEPSLKNARKFLTFIKSKSTKPISEKRKENIEAVESPLPVSPNNVYISKSGFYTTEPIFNDVAYNIDIFNGLLKCFVLDDEGKITFIEKEVKARMKEPKELRPFRENSTFYLKEYNENCDEIIFITSDYRALRTYVSKLRANFKRQAIRLSDNSNHGIAGFTVFNKSVNSYLLSVTSIGRYKLCSIDDYRITNLGGRGVKNFPSNYGKVIFCEAVKLGDKLEITTNKLTKSIILSESDIKSRSSKGRKLGKKVTITINEISIYRT